MTNDIRWFEELGRDDIAIAGGKGANLGEMTRAGLPVPPGFVIAATAYHEMLDHSGLRGDFERQLAELDIDDIAALEAVSQAIQGRIREATMPADVQTAAIAAYQELSRRERTPNVSVAVRSSATMEDTKAASFAGMNRSFLNVHGDRSRSATCRTSGPRSTARGLSSTGSAWGCPASRRSPLSSSRWSTADRSGVAFSIDPPTGRPADDRSSRPPSGSARSSSAARSSPTTTRSTGTTSPSGGAPRGPQGVHAHARCAGRATSASTSRPSRPTPACLRRC